MAGRQPGDLATVGGRGDAVRMRSCGGGGATPLGPMNAPVKIACRHVWKVYGDDPSRFFRDGDGGGDSNNRSGDNRGRNAGDVPDNRALWEEFEAAGHIGAACNVSFEVFTGEIFVIMGLSGSGKSTVLRCLSRLIEPTAGQVLVDGEDLLRLGARELIEFRRHKMGMVFQNFGLLPHLSVLDNIAFPLKVQNIGRPQREARAREVIELVGLQGREDSFPRQLSGGQQQRVGIARSLAVEPDMWFLDEPFSALDPLIRRQMQDEFLRLQKRLHKTIVFITHDFLEALRLADRIAIMKDGEIAQVGAAAELVLNPADEYVAEFTREVPRARIITAGDIATVATVDAAATVDGVGDSGDGDSTVTDARIDAAATLQQLMARLADHPGGITVQRGGETVGRVTAVQLIKALAARD